MSPEGGGASLHTSTAISRQDRMSARASKRLAQLFERELRQFDASGDGGAAVPKRSAPRVSQELDQQVVEFASATRTDGHTPEQMLVELKTLLSTVAPEVPSSQRTALVATVTGRALDAFLGKGSAPN